MGLDWEAAGEGGMMWVWLTLPGFIAEGIVKLINYLGEDVGGDFLLGFGVEHGNLN